METKNKYESADIALENLKALGYTEDYNIKFDHLVSDASDYTIDYLYRYEGMSNPDDESSVYGIRNTQTGEKGVFVSGNLSFLEGKKRDIILELEIRHRKEH